MDSRLAEQLVAWHNSHPLARRISIFDVHTLGVVALPFMRAGRPAAPVEPGFAPVADQPVSEAAVPDADQGLPARRSWLDRLPQALRRSSQLQQGWPLFNERFINRLSPRRVARFALAHGHTSPPGAPDWPHRSIEIDEDLMARTARKSSGAWPVELYLMTAGIDAGPARTRVLMAYGSGQRLHVLGRRCLAPRRLALALLPPALLIAAAAALWWNAQHGEAADVPSPPAPAASAASAAVLAPAEPASAAAASAAVAASEIAMPAATAASSPDAGPSAAASATSAPPAAPPAAEVPFATAPAGIPDIRPRLGMPGRTAARAAASQAAAAEPVAEAAAPPKPSAKAADKKPTKDKTASQAEAPPEPKPRAQRETPAKTVVAKAAPEPAQAEESASKGSPQQVLEALGSRRGAPAVAPEGRQVALVGPASASKAQAEATLERMRSLLGQTVREPGQLQAQVIQTKEGWRPAVWPFTSREQAQLINATLIASGLRTRAVDF